MQFIYKPLDDGASGNRGRPTTRWAEECGIRNQFDSSSSAKSLEDVVFPGTVKKTGQLRPVVAHFISLCSFVIHVEVLLSLSQCMWPSFLILLRFLLQTELYTLLCNSSLEHLFCNVYLDLLSTCIQRETLTETVNEIPHQVVAPSHIEHTSHMYRRLELNCGECLGGALSVDCIDFLCDHRADQIDYWPMTRPVHAKTSFLSVY